MQICRKYWTKRDGNPVSLRLTKQKNLKPFINLL